MSHNQETSPLKDQEQQELAHIMNIKYATFLRGRSFSIKTEGNQHIAHAEVTLQNADASFYYPVRGRLHHPEQNLSLRESILLMLDYIDCYFEEYFQEEENVYLPIDWADFSWDGFRFQLKGQVLNLKSEAMADEFLASHSQAH